MTPLYRLLPTLAACLGFGWTAIGQEATKPADDPLAGLPPDMVAAILASMPKAWGTTAKLRVAFGEKQNVVLSHANTADSGFVRSGLDIMAIRQSEGSAADMDLYLFMAGTRYFRSQVVDGEAFNHEANVFVGSQWHYAGKFLKFSAEARGSLSDAIIDVSNTDVKRGIARLQEGSLTVLPTVRWTPKAWWWLEAEAQGAREKFRDGAFDAKVGYGVARLGWQPSERFSARLSAGDRRTAFDRLEQRSEIGRSLAGTLLRTRDREADLRVIVGLDAAGKWTATTLAGGSRSTDNGSGYFNFRNRRVSEEIAWTSGGWKVEVTGEAGRRNFLVQDLARLLPGFDPPKRLREEFSAAARIERKLDAHWSAYGEYRWERNRCNDPIESYRMNESLLGLRWSWEK